MTMVVQMQQKSSFQTEIHALEKGLSMVGRNLREQESPGFALGTIPEIDCCLNVGDLFRSGSSSDPTMGRLNLVHFRSEACRQSRGIVSSGQSVIPGSTAKLRIVCKDDP
jgi:hypothetical protein